MRRRDISKALFASAAGSTLLARQASAQTGTAPSFPRTQAEQSANVTVADYARPNPEIGAVHLSRYLGWDPTGASSSRTAFNNAMELIYEQGQNHTEAAQIGGRIIVPNGIALLDSPVPIACDNIEIYGGHGATVRTNGAFPAFKVKSTSLQKIYGVTIHGLRFTSSVADRSIGSGAIEVIGAEMLRILHCKFHLITHYGVRWENVINGYLQHCDFDSGDWANAGMAYGLLGEANATSGNNASHIHFNTFRRCTVAGVKLVGQELMSATRRECAGNSVVSNDFEHNYGDALQVCRNRALDVRSNWFENNGQDGESGHGHIMDLATDDDESSGAVASGLGAANCFASNVFGGQASAHADFQHIGLKFQTGSIIEKNYFTSGRIGILATCSGLIVRDNWSTAVVPTLVGTLPAIRVVENNKLGPSSSFAGARPWGGSFYDYDYRNRPRVASNGDSTPSLLDSTFERITTLLLSNTAATNITYFDDGYEGQIIRIIATNGNSTLINGTDNGINLAGAANYAMSAKDTITLQLIDTGGFTRRWLELGRSQNR